MRNLNVTLRKQVAITSSTCYQYLEYLGIQILCSRVPWALILGSGLFNALCQYKLCLDEKIEWMPIRSGDDTNLGVGTISNTSAYRIKVQRELDKLENYIQLNNSVAGNIRFLLGRKKTRCKETRQTWFSYCKKVSQYTTE